MTTDPDTETDERDALRKRIEDLETTVDRMACAAHAMQIRCAEFCEHLGFRDAGAALRKADFETVITATDIRIDGHTYSLRWNAAQGIRRAVSEAKLYRRSIGAAALNLPELPAVD